MQAVYGNGATGAADACVGLFVVSAFMCIVMHKTVKVKNTKDGGGHQFAFRREKLALNTVVVAVVVAAAAVPSMCIWHVQRSKNHSTRKDSFGQVLPRYLIQ